jgi:hypothetical protein
MMGAMMGNGTPPAATGVPPGPFHATSGSAPAVGRQTEQKDRPPISLAVAFAGPGSCRVSVSFAEGWAGRRLHVGVLDRVVGAGPGLRGVTVGEEKALGGALVVRLPGKSPSGRYEGELLDKATKAAVGRLTVEITR